MGTDGKENERQEKKEGRSKETCPMVWESLLMNFAASSASYMGRVKFRQSSFAAASKSMLGAIPLAVSSLS